jgi:anti-sigma factor RsiW
MRCEQARELIGAHVDRELNSSDAAAVAAHIEDCPRCKDLMRDIRHISAAIGKLGREPAPPQLVERVRSSLAGIAEQQEARRRIPWGILRQAAQLAAACAFGVLLTWWVLASGGQTDRLEGEILSAHVRSLLQDSPIQVASSDTHAVKPWFAGRVNFSPDVKDLSAEGFPLLGARLDYVAERRVGVLVYRRRLHIINVFMWPASAPATPPKLATKNGYHLLAWNTGAISYWAVSDLEAGELRRLQSLL